MIPMSSDQLRLKGNPVNGSKSGSSVRDEVTRWFFADYLSSRVTVKSCAIAQGSEFILDYWGPVLLNQQRIVVPLHHCTPDGGEWLLDGATVAGLLERNYSRLRAQGYAHTAVPDRQVTVYHNAGAAIDMIWSHCRADDSEIERVAMHFEIARGSAGWRVVGIQEALTRADSLNAVWGGAT